MGKLALESLKQSGFNEARDDESVCFKLSAVLSCLI